VVVKIGNNNEAKDVPNPGCMGKQQAKLTTSLVKPMRYKDGFILLTIFYKKCNRLHKEEIFYAKWKKRYDSTEWQQAQRRYAKGRHPPYD
jgi:hypothetical protein